MDQLTLDVHLPDDETFGSFVAGENQQLIAQLKRAIAAPQGELFHIYAEQAVGCSHILHAGCELASSLNLPATLVPLSQKQYFSPAILIGAEHMSLIAIDDIDLVCGEDEWEYAIFDLINRIKETAQTTLIFSSKVPLSLLSMKLPDLTSRLSWGTTYHLTPLSEQQKLQMLSRRAQIRGLSLPDEVANFLISRASRDLRSLVKLLERLDKASMQQQRKLTIPFVKQVLAL